MIVLLSELNVYDEAVWVSQKFCNISDVNKIVIIVIGTLKRTLLYYMSVLKAAQMNEQHYLIWLSFFA